MGDIYKQIIYFWLLPPGVWEISIIQNQIQNYSERIKHLWIYCFNFIGWKSPGCFETFAVILLLIFQSTLVEIRNFAGLFYDAHVLQNKQSERGKVKLKVISVNY